MANLTIGDMASSFQLRRDNARIKGEMLRLSQEVSTGKKADLGKAVAGDFGPIVGIDRQLEALDAYGRAGSEAGIFASSVQRALEGVEGLAQDVGERVLHAASSGFSPALNGYLLDAPGVFESAVSMLNGQAAGTSLFSGAATDTAALIDGDAMLASIQALVAGETSAAGIVTALDAWFGPGGGFETTAYQGSTNDIAGFRVGEGIEADVKLRADDTVIRETLKGLALAALAEDGPLDPASVERTTLANASGEVLLGNQGALIAARGRVGAAEAKIDDAAARNAAEQTALKITRNNITNADPYETAVKLRGTEVQLEALYSMTARLSRLSLVSFLR